MKKRGSHDLMMTTKALQIRHPDIYQEFFSQNDFVCSVPQIMSWGYTASRRVQPYVHMKQKMPTRMYIGLTKTTTGTSERGSLKIYGSYGDEFIEKELEDIYSPQTVNLLKSVFEKYFKQTSSVSGVNISVLSEFDRGGGFGFSGSLSNLMATVLLWLEGGLNIVNLQNEDSLEKTIRTSLKIDNEIFHPNTKGAISGLMPLVSIEKGSSPVIQIGKQSYKINDSYEVRKNYDGTMIDLLQHMGIEEIESLPIDYGIISAGIPKYAKELKRLYQENNSIGTRTYLNHILEEKGVASKIPEIDGFSSFWQINYERIVQCFLNIGRDCSKQSISRLIYSFYRAGRFSALAEQEGDFRHDFYGELKKIEGKGTNNLAIMPLSGTSGEGTYLFVGAKGKVRDTVEKIIASIESQGYKNMHLKYASWRDGGSADGIIINQSIGQGLFSAYVPVGSLKFTYADGRSIVSNYLSLLKLEYEGFLLDTVGKKIYHNGEKLTSSQLKSQVTTVDVLLILLSRIGEDVHHKDFPLSSYSKSKNEMVGKIIVPLKKLVKERYDIDLGISCYGGLYDFYLRIDPKDLSLFHTLGSVPVLRSNYDILRRSSLVNENVVI